MGKRVADISMSLDGFITGPNPGLASGLGTGGEVLHRWAVESNDPRDKDLLASATAATGAVVMGRRLFDFVDGPQGWDETMGYGAGEVGQPPIFVVTHDPPPHVRLPLDIRFVTEGLAAGIEQASRAAGDNDAVVMGGGAVVGEAIKAGLVEELRIHLAPALLGDGTKLFLNQSERSLTLDAVQRSEYAVHLTYRLDS